MPLIYEILYPDSAGDPNNLKSAWSKIHGKIEQMLGNELNIVPGSPVVHSIDGLLGWHEYDKGKGLSNRALFKEAIETGIPVYEIRKSRLAEMDFKAQSA